MLNRTHRRRVCVAVDPEDQGSDRADKIKAGFDQLDAQCRICFCLVLRALRYDTDDHLGYRLYCPCWSVSYTHLLKLFGEVDLEDVMAHPTLYKHYPSLKSYTVELLEGAPNNINGGFNSQQKKIRINANTLREGNFESTLIHEIQHAIQEQEGFESVSYTHLDRR